MKTTLEWLFLLTFSVAFSSCQNNDAAPDQAAGEEESLSTFTLLATLSSDNARLTHDSTGTDTTRHGRGGHRCGLTEVAVADLPAAVTAYLTATYAGATVERAGQTEASELIVHITKADGTPAALLFDASGTFVSEKTAGRKHGTPVAVADLPAAVTAYLTANYGGATPEKAFQNSEGNLVVVLRKADGSRVGTAFDAAGTFLREVTFTGKRGKKGRGR